MAAFGGNESCPNCGAQMAADQRYCLTCGHRRGEPRLPFMDAVVFMESMNAPGAGAGSPPPPPSTASKSGRMNANAALIAGVATLVLAIGVGFLIGRSGHENSAPAAAAPQIIKVEGGSGRGGVEETASSAEESSIGGKSGNEAKSGGETAGNGGKSAKAPEAKEEAKQEEEAAAKTAEVLHAEGPLAKPKASVGEACEKGTPGCGQSGKFEGNFFGE
jgi:hypothetical protein